VSRADRRRDEGPLLGWRDVATTLLITAAAVAAVWTIALLIADT